ncbi:MAG: hypothetical protein WAV20_19755 [Blastocatellia bacterium]
MTGYRIEPEPAVDADIEAAFHWYECEDAGLGFELSISFGMLTGGRAIRPNGSADESNNLPVSVPPPEWIPLTLTTLRDKRPLQQSISGLP